MTQITISLIKADVGGYPGHSAVHPELIQTAKKKLETAKKSGSLIDFRVLSCGDDLEHLMERIRRMEIALAFISGIFFGVIIGGGSQQIAASGAFLALTIALMGRP